MTSGSSSTKPWLYSNARSTLVEKVFLPTSRGFIAAIKLSPADVGLSANDRPPADISDARASTRGHTSWVGTPSAGHGSETSRASASIDIAEVQPGYRLHGVRSAGPPDVQSQHLQRRRRTRHAEPLGTRG